MPSSLPVLTIVHQATSTPGLVGQIIKEMGGRLDIRCPAIGDPLPTTMANHSAAIVVGGPMSANDDHQSFIRDELTWIPMVLAAQKPYLGICLGAQLLARALGARVTPHPQEQREIGYVPIYPTSVGRPLFPGPLMVYQWHQEGFDLPDGAHLLATGKTFPHQAFRHGARAYGLQFHPEMTRLMVNHWTTAGADHLTAPGAQGRPYHLSQHRLYHPEVERWLRRFLRQWLGLGAPTETIWERYGTEPSPREWLPRCRPSSHDGFSKPGLDNTQRALP